LLDLQNPIWSGGDDAVAGLAQCLETALPGGGAEISAMQKHRGSTIWLRRCHVHVRHRKVGALGRELEPTNLIGILETFKLGAVASVLLGMGRRQHANGQEQTGDRIAR
jgi:hypothetical protein